MDEGRWQHALAGVAAGTASAQELHRAFLHATLWCEAPESPGFVARGRPPEAVVAVYSSPDQLAADRAATVVLHHHRRRPVGPLAGRPRPRPRPRRDGPLRLRPSALERITVVEVTKGGPW